MPSALGKDYGVHHDQNDALRLNLYFHALLEHAELVFQQRLEG